MVADVCPDALQHLPEGFPKSSFHKLLEHAPSLLVLLAGATIGQPEVDIVLAVGMLLGDQFNELLVFLTGRGAVGDVL